MKAIIYLIGEHEERLTSIKKTLDPSYQYFKVTKSELMSMVIKKPPKCIIIIEDEMDRDGFLLIENTVSFEYVPIICVSFEKEAWEVEHHLEQATYIDSIHMKNVLMVLVQQATAFATLYHGKTILQDTNEIMDEAIKSTVVDYIDAETAAGHDVLKKYLDSIYDENLFIDNSPQGIWLIKEIEGKTFEAYYVSLIHNEVFYEISFKDENLDFTPFMETGYLKNSDLDEVSDINEIDQLIPDSLIEVTGDIRNIASYAMKKMMVIAVNFHNNIRQSDLNIIKSFTLKIDMMMAIKEKVIALEESFEYTMNALARAAEGKDDVTGHHIKRVNYYSKAIAKEMALPSGFVKNIFNSAQMHDVGKILIPEALLNKPGKLSEQEYDAMKLHTVYGEEVIGDSIHLSMASQIARYHHEKYDGSGYPDGLVGESIPLEARIVSLADIYDALRSERPYKRGFTHEEAKSIILEGDGRVEPKHFDPKVLEVFRKEHKKFEEIYETYKD